MADTTDLCAFCEKEILAFNRTWGYHQCYENLKESATTCKICSRLYEDVVRHIGVLPNAKATHRWTMRKSARIREIRDFVVVTFRLIFEKEAAKLNCPVRNFFLIPEKGTMCSNNTVGWADLSRDLGHVPATTNLGSSTGSDAALLQIMKWVDECESHHPRCAPERKRQETQKETELNQHGETASLSDFVPTRLLDVGCGPGDAIRLVETMSSKIRGKYVTLSHRWGDKPMFQLKDQTKERFKAKIEWHELPATFRHAIEITRRLKTRYLWIDSLCIIQDNNEFHIEGQLMHQVYRHSFCNLSAAASEDSSGGLIRARFPEAVLPLAIHLPTSKMLGNKVWRMFPGDLWNGELLEEPLYKRGWVFQERMLSPRLLHFTSRQIFWDCATLSACETLPQGLPEPLDKSAATDREWRERLQYSKNLRYLSPLAGTGDGSLEHFWESAVRSYTSCNLTFPEADKLNAIWGIAKLVRDALDEQYAVGLWGKNLHEQLAWKVVDYKQARRLGTITDKKVPSWSWASIDGSAIQLPERLTRAEQREMYVQDHAGGGEHIHFQLEGHQFVLHDAAPRTWKDQLETWDKHFKKLSPAQHTFNKQLVVKRRSTHLSSDLQPELQTIGIAIKGHVVSTSLIEYNDKWTFDLDGTSHDRLDVFPDEDPRKRAISNVNYSADRNPAQFAVVLAATLIHSQLRPQEKEYDGVGLVLGHINDERFKRLGAFRFHALSHSAWEYLNKTSYKELDLPIPQNDSDPLDFWLE